MSALPASDAAAGAGLSWLAFALNVTLHFSQVPLMRVMLSDKDAASLERYSPWPTLFQACATAFWLAYGVCVLPGTPALVANNAIGLVLSLAYTIIFVLVRPTLRGKVIIAASWFSSVAPAILVYGLLYSRDAPARDAWASALTTLVTIALWASPLVALRDAALRLDVSKVPVPLTLAMTATTLTWLIVGFLVGDITLVVCSAIGLALSTLQLFVLLGVTLALRRRSAGKGAVPVVVGAGDAGEAPKTLADTVVGHLSLRTVSV